MSDIRSIKKLGALHAEKRRLDGEVARVKREIAKLEEGVMEYFSRHGLQSQSIDGQTIYLHRALRANYAESSDRELTCAALRAAGHGDLVVEGVNLNSLSSLVNELIAGADLEDQEGGVVTDPAERLRRVAPELAETVRVYELVSIRARKG